MTRLKRSPAALAGASRAGSDHRKMIGPNDSPPSASAQHADPAAIVSAAGWLAQNWDVAPQPITRTLRQMYGLAFIDAVKAMAAAKRLMDDGGAP